MKLSRILAVLMLIIMVFNIASCDSKGKHTPTGNNNGGNNDEITDKDPEAQRVTYVYSISQKVLHLPDCYHTESISEEYKFTYSGDISILFEKGYTICKDCLMVNAPDDEEKTPDPDEVSKEEATFVVHRTKLKIHLLDCYHVDNMNEDNIKYTNLTLEELLATEHIPCGTCMPDEYEEYKKANPDKFKSNN